ncbi:guanine deaminase [Georgenia sp. Z1491]|uniref:guanine deaminase n=1 Tax=Georgenia sp. Z1491 TaxID=3416707 RepID=UPI003CEE1D60
MTIYRALVLDTPGDPTATDRPAELRSHEDCALVVEGGTIVARTDYATARAEHPEHDVVDIRDGVLLPGLVDTHVHYPQVRAIGGLGMPLLDWLDACALPEEARLSDPTYARGVARDFVDGLLGAGTTTALVFGSHFEGAVDALFTEAEATGLRVTSGLVVSDRTLPGELLTTPEESLAAGRRLAERWHGRGRLRYAVTPRFALSTTDEMLAACGELLGDDTWFTTHVNENVQEIADVRELFPDARHYVDTYDQHGLIGERSVFAHNVHPTPHGLEVLGAAGAAVAHCPTSNAALGSGLFPLRAHLAAGVRVALGSDVGAGTGFSLLKEGLQAYFAQQLLGADGVPLAAPDLLHLATRSGATALGLDESVGDLSVGKQLDAVLLRPGPRGALRTALRHASDPTDALAKIFALGTPADIDTVWIGGDVADGPRA